MSDARVATRSDHDAAPSDVTMVTGLARAEAHQALPVCCAFPAWVAAIEDLLEAFAAHARIGAPRLEDARGAAEQVGAASVSAEELVALERDNERHQAGDERVHVPLLLSPNGYSVYRGS